MVLSGSFVLGLVLVATIFVAQTKAAINIANTSGTDVDIDIKTNSTRNGCPNINLGLNSRLELSVVVNGQECQPYGNAAWGAKTGKNCPSINISNCSKLDLSIKFSSDAPRFQGLNLSNKANEDIDLVVNNGKCGVPNININNVSGSYITIRDQ